MDRSQSYRDAFEFRVQSDDLRSRVCQNRDWPAYWGKNKRPPSVGWVKNTRPHSQFWAPRSHARNAGSRRAEKSAAAASAHMGNRGATPPTRAEGRVGGKAEGAPRGPQVRHRPWSELKRTKGQGDPATLQWWIPMGSWSELKRTKGQKRPCDSPTAETLRLSNRSSERRRSGYQVPNTVMRQRLIRTVR